MKTMLHEGRNLITQLVSITKKSKFFRNVIVLMFGAATAQVIPILVSPLLTRIYRPDDFGVYAIFMSMISCFMPIVGGKYEVAMVLPKSSKEANHLFGVALRFNVVLCLLLLVITFLFHELILNLFNSPSLSGWLYFAPIALFCNGVMKTINYYANRYRGYANISKGKVLQSIVIITINIVVGLLYRGPFGLLFGSLAGFVFAVLYMFVQYRGKLTKSVLSWSKPKNLLMKRYREYPLYNATSGLLDGVRTAMPVFFLMHYFPESSVGYYALVIRISNAPLSLISSSVSQINLKKVADLVNKRESVKAYLYKITAVLSALVFFPAIVMIVFAPRLFSFVFGEEWRVSGEYAQIIMPAIAVKFIASTLSSTLGATNNNKLGALWKSIAFIVSLAVFCWLGPKKDIVLMLRGITISTCCLYILYWCFILFAAGRPKRHGIS